MDKSPKYNVELEKETTDWYYSIILILSVNSCKEYNMLFREYVYNIICYICVHIHIYTFRKNAHINICINSKNLAWGQLMKIQDSGYF